jgi:hypothetical protein
VDRDRGWCLGVEITRGQILESAVGIYGLRWAVSGSDLHTFGFLLENELQESWGKNRETR